MKTKKYNYIHIVLALVCYALTISCSDDNDRLEHYIEVDSPTLLINKIGLTSFGELPSTTIHSNVYWIMEIQNEASWLSSDLKAGTGSTRVVFYAEPNADEASRTANIRLTTKEGLTKQFSVSQNGKSETLYLHTESLGPTEGASLSEVNSYTGWDIDGIGAYQLNYSGTGTFVENNNPSEGYIGASGGNHIAFTENNSEFIWGRVVNTQSIKHFQLNLGIRSSTTFNADDLTLYISKDKEQWRTLPYSRKSNSGWALAETKFSVRDSSDLYFKLIAKTGGIFYLDDIVLTEDLGKEGETIYFDHLAENMGETIETLSPINSYKGWLKKGIGSEETSYSGTGTFVDSSNPSTTYKGASGGNNITFNTDNSSFIWGKVINTLEETPTFRLNAGIFSTSTFKKENLKLYISKDKNAWTELTYSRSTKQGWDMAEVKFKVSSTNEFYFKFVALTGEIFRIDDIYLSKGEYGEGNEVIFNEEVTEEVILEEDFSWLSYGNAIPYETSGEKRYDTWTTEEKERGWTSTVVTGSEQLCYARVGFVKLGKTNYAGDLISPKLSAINGTANVKVSFKAAGYISAGSTTSNGTKDDNLLKIIIQGGGTTDTEKFTINNYPNDKKADKEEVKNDIWAEDRAYSFTITGATSETQIQFMGGEQFDLKDIGKGKNRIFLDDIKVTTIP